MTYNLLWSQETWKQSGVHSRHSESCLGQVVALGVSQMDGNKIWNNEIEILYGDLGGRQRQGFSLTTTFTQKFDNAIFIMKTIIVK